MQALLNVGMGEECSMADRFEAGGSFVARGPTQQPAVHVLGQD